MASKISFELTKTLGILSQKDTYTKEFNCISWQNRQPVYDIRSWKLDENGQKIPLKGISLTKEELSSLKKLLSSIDLEV